MMHPLIEIIDDRLQKLDLDGLPTSVIARAIVLCVVDAMIKSGENYLMQEAAADLPVTKAVDQLFTVAAIHGAALPPQYEPPNTPFNLWFKAMLGRLEQELEES